jgi:hypothetical protein
MSKIAEDAKQSKRAMAELYTLTERTNQYADLWESELRARLGSARQEHAKETQPGAMNRKQLVPKTHEDKHV